MWLLVPPGGFGGRESLWGMPHRKPKATYCKLGFAWLHVLIILIYSPHHFILLGGKLTIFWLLFGFKSAVAWGRTVPSPERVEEVAVIWGTVVLVVLVPAVGPWQGQGPLPPGPPVGGWDWPAGLILRMLIFICFSVRTIHHLYGDLKNSE